MSDVWSWADVPGWTGPPPAPRDPGPGRDRPNGGSLSRFGGLTHHARRDWAAVRPDHPALAEARTLFPSTVVDAAEAPRLLVSGHNDPKLGRTVLKGPWRGCAIYGLTLEERATCPRSCDLWRECYGNAMPYARRHRVDAAFWPRLDGEISWLLECNPAGLAVRLHILGDFVDVPYTRGWAALLALYPRLRVWGYTAHPRGSEVGGVLARLNTALPDRCTIRFSVPVSAPLADMQAAALWRKPEAPNVTEGLVCPAQTGGTAACATCGLCWAPAAAAKRILFVGHGMRRRGQVTP